MNRSLYSEKGVWREDPQCGSPVVSDQRFAIDIVSAEGSRYTVTTPTPSSNGELYTCEYRCTEENESGTVTFIRFRARSGSVFWGKWNDGLESGEWILQVDHA